MSKRLIIITASLYVLTACSAFAQVKTQWGVFGGLSLFHTQTHYSDSSVDFKNASDTKTGFTAGAVFNIDILNFLAVEPGIAYSQRGGQISISETNVSPDGTIFSSGKEHLFKYNYNFLAFPIHAKILWPFLPILKPYALAGLNFAFLLSAKVVNDNNSSDLLSSISSFAFAMDFGGGIEISLPIIVPFVEYDYDTGISNLNKNPTKNASYTTSGSEIKAGIRFKL